jgi:hypothetical protein
MKKLMAAALLAALIWGCGSDSSTNSGGINISLFPSRGFVDYNDSIQFHATVTGASDDAVIWRANNVTGGDSLYGLINTNGIYMAPASTPMGADSVKITVLLAIDTTKTANAYAILVDPDKIYVTITGSDTTGVGSESYPYRTITKALTRATSGKTIYVGPGDFNIAAGEDFPLIIPTGVTVHGCGPDSTFITGLGGIIGDQTPWTRAAFITNGDIVTIERMLIRSANSLGVGIWLKPGIQTKLVKNTITGQNIAIYASGAMNPRPILDGNRLISDSIGVVTADSIRPVLRNNYVAQCTKYGIDIRDLSRPDLGADDSTYAGGDTIRECGDNQYHWLIYNHTPNTIQAMGDYWQDQVLENNDMYIYDDEESGGASGAVILRPSRKR